MQQTALEVTPTRTIYTFQAAQVTLTVKFFTPAFPNDLDLLSRPVTYLTFAATGEGAHDVTLLIDVDPLIAVNTRDEEVTWGRSRIPGLTVLNAGSREQRVLNRPGDDLRIDWGYFHLAVPDSADAQVAASSDALRSFAATGTLPASDDLDMPRISLPRSPWARSQQRPSCGTCCWPTPRGTQSSIWAANCAPTGSATTPPCSRCWPMRSRNMRLSWRAGKPSIASSLPT
jgi:hypothetical protein